MKTSKILMLTAALTMVWGCSTKDDDSPGTNTFEDKDTPSTYTFEANEKPAWSVNLTGSDTDPQWQDIDRSLYESWMYVTVKLEDELAAHATTDDRMVVFIGDEQRTKPAVPSDQYADGSVYFVMTIGGNSTDREVNIRLYYWCAQLHQVFTIEEQATFTPELPYGNTSDYVPPLLKGCKKYPVQSALTVSLPADAPFTKADGDLVAFFVGNECRGVGSVGQPITVFRTSAGEVLQVRYYSMQNGGIYTLTQSITLGENEDKNVILSF